MVKNPIFSTKNRPTTKTWGGGAFDIVSPTFKIVGGGGGGRVPPPRDFRPCLKYTLMGLSGPSVDKLHVVVGVNGHRSAEKEQFLDIRTIVHLFYTQMGTVS